MKRGIFKPPVDAEGTSSAATHTTPPPPPAEAPSVPLPPPEPRAPSPQRASTEAETGDLAVLLGWQAYWLLELPRAWTLSCRHESGRTFRITTSRTTYELCRRQGLAVLHGEEWLAMLKAAGQGRACLAVGQWLTPSMPPPDLDQPFDLPPQPLRAALGGDWDLLEHPMQHLTTRQVLTWFGCVAQTLDQPMSSPSVQQEGLL